MAMTQRHARRVAPDEDVIREFGADYSDTFSVTADFRHAARDWAYYSLRGADTGRGVFRRSIWGGLLGFRLASPTRRTRSSAGA